MYARAHSMLSGSAVQVPFVRSTRRILRAQLMAFSSGVRLIAGLRGPLLHALEAGPVRVHVGDGARRARGHARRVAAAQVALLHLPGRLHVVHRAERAGDRAHLAADAGRLEHDLRAGRGVRPDRVDRAGAHAPGLVALRAGVRDLLPGLVEVEHLDAREARVDRAVVLVAAGHLALDAAGALHGVDPKRLLHVFLRGPGSRRGGLRDTPGP